MKPSPRRSRFVRLAAGGLLLSAASPLIAADPLGVPAIVSPAPAPCGPSAPPESRWQAFWDRFRDPCATITPGAMPMRTGAAVNAWEGMMARKASADHFVIYVHEWYMGGLTLGPYGCSHLQHIAAALPCEPAFVIVEPEPSPAVNESRRLMVVQMLLSAGIADAERRVVVAFPTAEGMWSLEAASAYSRGHNYGAAGTGINTGFGNPLTPTQGGLTPNIGGFMGGFRGALSGGYTGF